MTTLIVVYIMLLWTDVDREVTGLKAMIETWKNDYVFLLQSSVTIPVGDANESWHMRLFGGDRVRVN